MNELIFKEKILLIDKYFESINDPHGEVVLPKEPEKFLKFEYIANAKASKEKKLLMCYFCENVDHNFSELFEFDDKYESSPKLFYFWLYFKVFGIDSKLTSLKNHQFYLNDTVVPALNRNTLFEQKYEIEKIDDSYFVDGEEMDIMEIFNMELTSEQLNYLLDELSIIE